MRRLCVICAVLLLALRAHAASIGLFSTTNCTSSTLTIPQGETRLFYITMSTEGLPASVDGIAGLRLRITGIPAGWTADATLNRPTSSITGDLFGPFGTIVEFSPALGLGGCVSLYTVSLTANSDVDDVILRAVNRTPLVPLTCETPAVLPPCPSTPCDPFFCIDGSQLSVNPTISVAPSTWARVKEVYGQP